MLPVSRSLWKADTGSPEVKCLMAALSPGFPRLRLTGPSPGMWRAPGQLPAAAVPLSRGPGGADSCALPAAPGPRRSPLSPSFPYPCEAVGSLPRAGARESADLAFPAPRLFCLLYFCAGSSFPPDLPWCPGICSSLFLPPHLVISQRLHSRAQSDRAAVLPTPPFSSLA